MSREIITTSSEETQKLAKEFAKKIKGGGIVCLEGDLGSGKTTFTQGLLSALSVEGPYTSPTFLVMKNYQKEIPNPIPPKRDKTPPKRDKIQNIYHIDAYRVGPGDILNLGWEEMISNPENIIIVEWADRIRNIIPDSAIWLKFEWLSDNKRRIRFEN